MSVDRPFFDPRMRGFRDRTEVDAFLALIDQRSRTLEPEPIALQEAAGRVLAKSVVARYSVPGFDRAAMDGYAVRAEESFGAGPYNPLAFTILGECLPGRAYPGVLGAGQAIRIMTGSPIPSGADAVLPCEQASEDEGKLIIQEPVPPGRHVGRIGEDIAAGQEVLTAGRRLRPQDLGLLASIGVDRVEVVRRPVVKRIMTGDELLPPGAAPEGYRIVDSNSPMLGALIERDGGVSLATEMLPDDRDRLHDSLCDPGADVILVSGGTSVGKEDHAPSLVNERGELLVHGVALRPASPTGFGTIGSRLVFLLPGNPVSCLCAYDLFAGRAIRRLGGRRSEWPYPSGEYILTSKISSQVGRVDYVRLRIRGDQAEPLAIRGASLLSSTTRADGFLLVPRDCEGYAEGEKVRIHLYDTP